MFNIIMTNFQWYIFLVKIIKLAVECPLWMYARLLASFSLTVGCFSTQWWAIAAESPVTAGYVHTLVLTAPAWLQYGGLASSTIYWCHSARREKRHTPPSIIKTRYMKLYLKKGWLIYSIHCRSGQWVLMFNIVLTDFWWYIFVVNFMKLVDACPLSMYVRLFGMHLSTFFGLFAHSVQVSVGSPVHAETPSLTIHIPAKSTSTWMLPAAWPGLDIFAWRIVMITKTTELASVSLPPCTSWENSYSVLLGIWY